VSGAHPPGQPQGAAIPLAQIGQNPSKGWGVNLPASKVGDLIETLLIMRTNCWHKLYAAKERTTGFA
jgi:hypothetical protein